MLPDRHDVLIRKARQDELVLERLLGDCDVDDDTLGFHAQQAAEKLLKAALAVRAILLQVPANRVGYTTMNVG